MFNAKYQSVQDSYLFNKTFCHVFQYKKKMSPAKGSFGTIGQVTSLQQI